MDNLERKSVDLYGRIVFVAAFFQLLLGRSGREMVRVQRDHEDNAQGQGILRCWMPSYAQSVNRRRDSESSSRDRRGKRPYGVPNFRGNYMSLSDHAV